MRIRLSLPMQLLVAIFIVVLFGGCFSPRLISYCYTFSTLFKEVLTIILPSIVFAFVITGILSFKRNAPIVLSVLLSTIFCSNGLVALVSYGLVRVLLMVTTCSASTQLTDYTSSIIEPLFSLNIASPIRPEHALLAAIGVGLFFSFVRWPQFNRAMNSLKNIIEGFMNWIIIPLLPLYVFGFLLKMKYEGAFLSLFEHYGSTFILIVAAQVLYLFWLYVVANGLSFKKASRAINNALPSYLTAFSTMSSTATLPVSIKAAEQNTHNAPLSRMAMPIMANVHLLGDSISTPILAVVTMSLFSGCVPSFALFATFVFYFCTTMFAVSGIPGGGILVMIPILQSILGFTPEMISVITTLYLLMDSFGTAANVMGDGALVIIVDKLLKKIGIRS